MKTFADLAFLAVTLLSLLLSGCGKKIQSASPAQNPPPASDKPTQRETVKTPFSIKGFYIGMPLDEARKVALEKLVEIGARPQVEASKVWFTRAEGAPEGPGLAALGGIKIMADANAQLAAVGFNHAFVNASFNVRDLDAKTFTQHFIDNYAIPGMEPLHNGLGWSYKNSDKGFEVMIFNDKDIYFLKIPKLNERNFERAQVNLPFSIKGFYIGMPLGEARKVASERLGEIGAPSQFEGWQSRIEGMQLGPGFAARGFIMIIPDTNGNVAVVDFWPRFVNASFNVSDLDAQDFTQEFTDNYKIPGMERLPNGRRWSYKNLDLGFEVVVSDDKNISLRKIPMLNERHFER